MLLERGDLLRALSAHLDDVRSEGGRIVLIAGEAGAGKTSLVRAFVEATARDGGTVALEGGCDALSTPRPLGPLVDIAPHMGGRTAELLASGASAAEVFNVFLSDLAGGARPVIAVFEDIHWADDARLDLLRFLARRIARTPALLLATYRDDEVRASHPLRVAMGDLATSASVRRLWVPPLSVEAVDALAGDQRVDARALHARTGGNPFYVTEVLSSMAAGSAADEVPPTVADAVIARAGRLSPDARSVLEAAAVIGGQVHADVIARIAAPDLPDVPKAHDAVATLMESGLLRDDFDGVVFRHELARATIEAHVSSERRRRLHARALEELRSPPVAPGSLARLAYHADEAGDADAVLEFAPAAAARASALRSHREAAAQYERALRHAEDLDPARLADLTEAWSLECWLTGRFEDAIESRRGPVRSGPNWAIAGVRRRTSSGSRRCSDRSGRYHRPRRRVRRPSRPWRAFRGARSWRPPTPTWPRSACRRRT
jgi:predicted ATPase